LSTLLLEREAIGGQAGTTSLIRNYLGFPHGVSGRELASRAMEQAMIMGTELVFVRSAVGLSVSGPERQLTLVDRSQACSRAVVIATGVTYRRLDVPGADDLLGLAAQAASDRHPCQDQEKDSRCRRRRPVRRALRSRRSRRRTPGY
jgi:thioredoxin reductase (NADPH)